MRWWGAFGGGLWCWGIGRGDGGCGPWVGEGTDGCVSRFEGWEERYGARKIDLGEMTFGM